MANKNLKIYFTIVAATAVFYLGFLVFPALAGYQIEMGLPNLPKGSTVSNPGQYIQYFFIFGLSLIGFLAVAAMAVGGIMWMAGGSITSTEKARNIIVGAVSGVVLLLCSYLLLYTIDPSLVNLTPHVLPLINIQKPAAPAAPPATGPAGAQTACLSGSISNINSQAECEQKCIGVGVLSYGAQSKCCTCNTPGSM